MSENFTAHEVCIGSLGQQKIYLNWSDVKDICTYAVSAAYEQTKRENENLKKQLEAKEQMIKELKKDLKRARAYIMSIDYETPALGGSKKDMERALLNIEQYCRDYFGD